MGIGVVVLVWAIPAALVLAVCVATLRHADADFRRRKPLTFLTGVAASAAGLGLIALFATALVTGNSDSPDAAYESIFDTRAEDCTRLLHGRTRLSTDAEVAEVVFESTCPDVAALLEKFNLQPSPDGESASLDEKARKYFLAKPDCSTPVVRVGSYRHWTNVKTVECAAHGLYFISARWVD